MTYMKHMLTFGLLCIWLAATGLAHADEIQVAVAANFSVPMQKIAQKFEQKTGHKALLSFGATGTFYAQIVNGGPFDVFLSADDTTTKKLATEGHAVTATDFTYATGKLALWSSDPKKVDAEGAVLSKGDFKHLSIASPATAPYGKAAMAVLDHMKLTSDLTPKLVQGESISHAYQFVTTGNAELGFVALSQIWLDGELQSGSVWIVPDTYYPPLHQNAILLKKGEKNAAAQELLDYLRTPEAQTIIKSFGYAI